MEPHVSPPHWHKHKCPWCAFVWEHHDCNDVHHNAVEHSHTCPGCGKCSWGKGIYTGPEVPIIRNGPAGLPGAVYDIHPDQRT